jgi:hypothetical protein
MGVSDEAKNVIPLKFLRKIKNKIFFPLVNSIRGHTVYTTFPVIQGGPSYSIFAIKPLFNCQKKLKFRKHNLQFRMYEMAKSFLL